MAASAQGSRREGGLRPGAIQTASSRRPAGNSSGRHTAAAHAAQRLFSTRRVWHAAAAGRGDPSAADGILAAAGIERTD